MEKKSNLYLLRIISILMILTLHYLNASIGGFINNNELSQTNKIIVNVIESICIISVNIFVITSGYFLIEKKPVIKVRKAINIVATIVFYAVIFAIIALILNLNEFNIDFIKTFIKSITDRWFTTIYIILLFIYPYINKLISNIDKNKYLLLIMILLFFFTVCPTLGFTVTVKDFGYGIINFVILYLIGGYIRKYCDDKFQKNSIIIPLWIITIIIISVMSFKTGNMWNYNNTLVIIAAILLFFIFRNLNIKNNKLINYCAGFSLDIYLIHGNTFIVHILYMDILNTKAYYTSNYMILHLVVSAIVVYIGCMIIGIAKRYIFKYTVDKFNDKIKLFNKEISI